MSINASRLKAIWLHLSAVPWYVWLCLAGIGIAVAFIFILRTEPVIRYAGGGLQLCGILTVFCDIHQTRKLFDHPPYLSIIKDLLRTFLLLRRNEVAEVSPVKLSWRIGEARAYGTLAAADADVTARLEALEKNVPLIHERISETQKEMDEEFQKLADELKREKQSREAKIKELYDKLEKAETGGVHISLIGALCLFVGVILSTWSIEIAKLSN